MRDSIVKDYLEGKMSKAAIARKYEISPSTVNRVLSEAGAIPSVKKPSVNSERSVPGNSEPVKESAGKAEREVSKEKADSIHSNVVSALMSIGVDDPAGIEALVSEFHQWLISRDQLEKQRLQDSMDLEALKSERGRIEERIFELSTKAANLEMTIGRMRATAENAQVAMSLVEERLTNMEERMASNRDLLIIASGIKSLLERGDIDDKTLAFVTEFDDMWSPTTDEVKKRAKNALIRYIDMASSKVKKWKNEY